MRIAGRHDNVLLQGSVCTAGGLVERPGSNEKVWVSHTYFCKILMKTAISILIDGINFLMNIHDLSSLGPCLSVLLISVLYPVFVDAFLYALIERLR